MCRPVPVAGPAAVSRHLRALRLWRMTLACRCLFAVFGRAPSKLCAVVRIVGHLEIGGPIDDVLDREGPGRAVAARICHLARGEFGIERALQLVLLFGHALAGMYR